jgi:hypothetical protein
MSNVTICARCLNTSCTCEDADKITLPITGSFLLNALKRHNWIAAKQTARHATKQEPKQKAITKAQAIAVGHAARQTKQKTITKAQAQEQAWPVQHAAYLNSCTNEELIKIANENKDTNKDANTRHIASNNVLAPILATRLEKKTALVNLINFYISNLLDECTLAHGIALPHGTTLAQAITHANSLLSYEEVDHLNAADLLEIRKHLPKKPKSLKRRINRNLHLSPAGRMLLQERLHYTVHPTYLKRDIRLVEEAIKEHVVSRKLKQHEFDALISIVLDISIEDFKTSRLLVQLNKGNMREAAAEILKTKYKECRKGEYKQFVSGYEHLAWL